MRNKKLKKKISKLEEKIIWLTGKLGKELKK